jgi:hypothetical protein
LQREAGRSRISVRVAPGNTACTRTPAGASSTCIACVRFSMYTLVPLSVPEKVSAIMAVTEPILLNTC